MYILRWLFQKLIKILHTSANKAHKITSSFLQDIPYVLNIITILYIHHTELSMVTTRIIICRFNILIIDAT